MVKFWRTVNKLGWLIEQSIGRQIMWYGSQMQYHSWMRIRKIEEGTHGQ